MKLLGKTALITGAARGIGRGCAIELARAGADVAINDRVSDARAEAVIAEIQALGRALYWSKVVYLSDLRVRAWSAAQLDY